MGFGVGSDLKSVQVVIIFTSCFSCLGRERAGLHTSQDWCARSGDDERHNVWTSSDVDTRCQPEFTLTKHLGAAMGLGTLHVLITSHGSCVTSFDHYSSPAPTQHADTSCQLLPSSSGIFNIFIDVLSDLILASWFS